MYKLFVYFWLITGAFGQTSTSSISGVVSDSSGGVIPGAKVVVANESTGVSQTQATTAAGVYSFPSLAVGTYSIVVEMKGFKTTRQPGNVLQVESPVTVNVALEVGSAADVVNVSASTEVLETTNATVGSVITQKEIVELPLNGRNPLGLLALEPGVVQRSANAAGTGLHVNGSRDMASNTTIDGIDANESSVSNPMNNIYRLNPDSIQEYKVTTSNPTAESGRNSGANTSIATRSGTNEFHGTAYEFLRNTDLNSNEFFANALGTEKPELKLNQFGFNVGGPIKKNKTFFFASWQDTVVNYSQPVDQAYSSTPAVYTPSALAGVYRYWVANPKTPFVFNGQTITRNNVVLVDPHTGALRPGVRACADNTDSNCIASFNMFANDPSKIGADPTLTKLFQKMPAPNLYTVGDGLNTAGYQWNPPTRRRGQAWMTRVDHQINSNHNLFARYLYGADNTLGGDPNNSRPQLYPGFPPLGEVYRLSHNAAIGLHSVLSAHVANELTVGMSRFGALFTQGEANPDWPNVPAYSRAAGTAFNNIDSPYRNVPRTYRVITTPQILDNLSIVRGAHIIRTGFNFRFYEHNDQRGQPGGATVTPLISFSYALRPPSGFNLPATATTTTAGINSTDSNRLQGTINDIMGIPASLSQTFLGDLTHNNYLPFSSGSSVSLWTNGNRLKQYDSYLQDDWKIRKNLTISAGLRWEANPAPTEASGAVYVPDRPIVYSQGLVSFVHADRWFKNNNLGAVAPRFSVAWSPRADTAIRAGYAMAFDTLSSFQVTSVAGSVPGLTATCLARPNVASPAGCPSVPNLRIAQGFPEQLTPPTLQPSSFLTVPLTLNSSAQNLVTFDPNLKTPTVHQWNFSVQHQLPKGFVIQAAYIGKRGTRLYRGYDVNQINADPILPSFLLMQQNVKVGCKADGTGCPAGAVGASIPLVTSGIVASSFVTSTTTANDLNLNNAGNFASRVESNTLAAKLRPNQQFGTITYVDSGGDSYYHSFQTVLQKRFSKGLTLRAAYTFGKSIDDQSVDPIASSSTGGLSTTNSRTPADIRNWRNERGLSDFDRTHVLNASWVYDLPFGRGRMFGSGMPAALNSVVGGWSLKGIATAMSGEPFSVRSGEFTSNATHTSRADTVGPKPSTELTDAPGVIGPVYFFGDASSFAIPAPGQDGAGRNIFRAAPFWNIDLSAAKDFRMNERVKMELRAEFFNALNHPNFDNPRDASNSSTSPVSTLFGHTCCAAVAPASTRSIVDTGESARVIQVALKLSF